MANATDGEVRHTFCRICEALCGLEVDVEDGARRRHPPRRRRTSRPSGFACVKGLKQHKLYDSPDRAALPAEARRRATGERISWEQALARDRRQGRARSSARLAPDAIAMYVGTAAGFGVLHPVFAQGFMTGSARRACTRRRRRTAPTSSRSRATSTASRSRSRSPTSTARECLIIVGANPVISKWSFLQVSNPAQAPEGHRGARRPASSSSTRAAPRPRRSPASTSSSAPAPTCSSSSSFLHELIATGGVDRERVDAHHDAASRRSSALAAPWTPERTERGHAASPRRRCARWSPPIATARRRGALLLDRRQHGRQRRARVLAAGGASTPSPATSIGAAARSSAAASSTSRASA